MVLVFHLILRLKGKNNLNYNTMIAIFKTSVINSEQAERIRPYLDQLHTIIAWNFDLEDCDNILRIESTTNVSASVISILEEHGFLCEEIY